MQVHELIERLRTCNPKAEVVIGLKSPRGEVEAAFAVEDGVSEDFDMEASGCAQLSDKTVVLWTDRGEYGGE